MPETLTDKLKTEGIPTLFLERSPTSEFVADCPTQRRPAGIVDLGRTSDHELASDTAYIHLEIEPLHRRAREMPRQTARDGSAADELVGHEEMDVKDRIDLGCGHIRPAEAERRHTLLHRPEHETRFLAHRLGRLVAAPNDAPFIAGAARSEE